MRKYALSAGLACALAMGGPSWSAEAGAGPKTGKAYLLPGFSIYRPPEGDSFHGGPSIGLGYMLDETVGAEFLYSNVDVNYNTPMGAVEDDADLLWLNMLYKLRVGGKWQPFALWGVQRTKINGDKDIEAAIGVGLFRQIDQRWSFRSDLRALHSADEGGLSPFAFIGLTAILGDVSPSPPSPTPPPPPRCPNTPAGVPVDGEGCPLDSDQDGVPDYQDDCPGTIANAKVDEKGCHTEVREAVRQEVIIEFDFDSSEIRPVHYQDIRQVAEFMRTHPGAKGILEGHTDVRGSNTYNQSLSERRANAVLRRLVEVEGIAADRLRAVGLGETRPIAEDGSEEGHQRNRRVRGRAEGVRMVILMK